MGQLEQKYLDVLEKHGWSICGYTNDGRVEIEKHSPAGEDFIVCVEVEDFPETIEEYYKDFDIEEHIEMWIDAKRNGVKGVPFVSELVHDAEAIDEMLRELSAALTEAEAA